MNRRLILFVKGLLLSMKSHRSVPGGPREYRRHSCQAMSVSRLNLCTHKMLTVSGVSCAVTLVPSNKKRTVFGSFPCLSQKAFINFSNLVLLLILKKTSLLLSVTLMFRCSAWGGASAPFGLWSASAIAKLWKLLNVCYVLTGEVAVTSEAQDAADKWSREERKMCTELDGGAA